jgi:hypothetical protein
MKKKFVLFMIFIAIVLSSIWVIELTLFSAEPCTCNRDAEHYGETYCRTKCMQRQYGGCGEVFVEESYCYNGACKSKIRWECMSGTRRGVVYVLEFCRECEER